MWIIIVLLLLLVILLLLFISTLYSALIPKFPLVSQQTRDEIVERVVSLDKELADIGVKHTILAGSLLGVARWKSIIPWDNDLDIGVLAEDIDKVHKLFPTAKETIFGLTVSYPNFSVDFFELHRDGDVLRYRPNTGNNMMEAWRENMYITMDEWNSIGKHGVFDGQPVDSIKDSTRYLDSSYTPKWRDEVVVHPLHSEEHRQVVFNMLRRSRESVLRFPKFCYKKMLY